MLELPFILERFAERTPLPVMARGILQRLLYAPALDSWFDSVAKKQYTRKLLFSEVFDLMIQVVFRQQPTIQTAYLQSDKEISASLVSVYSKLNGLETSTSAALVSHSAEKCQALIKEIGGVQPSLLPGYRIRILDGNALGARQHRLEPTRKSSAAPLPGKSLHVYEPASGLITASYPCEDAYTQERALLPEIYCFIEAKAIWIADRNFCTTDFLNVLAERGAAGIIREHDQIRFEPLEAIGESVCTQTGDVSEQRVRVITKGKEGLELRRIRIKLHKLDRNAQESIYLLTHVPEEHADAVTLASLYQERWDIG